jgi:D-alanyl-D-alanine carboxypeptidase
MTDRFAAARLSGSHPFRHGGTTTMRFTRRGALALGVAGLTAATVAMEPVAAAEPPARRPCSTAPTVPTDLPPLDTTHLDASIDRPLDRQATGVLVQIRGSAGCWDGTSGTARRGSPRPVPPDARFRIGSMTKMFTATVALQLVAEGRLDLDRSVQHYLPGLLPSSYPPITVRHVLTYTSGLNHVEVPHKTPQWFFAHRYDTWAPGSQLDLGQPVAFDPGTKQRYGNVDYIVAGLLIEKVTGRSWGSQVTGRIISRLRLGGTSVPGDDVRIRGPHAHGYEKVETTGGTRWVDVTAANTSLQWSAASMISTARDLDRFLVALLRGHLVPAAQLRLMTTPPDVPVYDGDDDPGNDRRAIDTVGLRRMPLTPTLTVIGKTGDRPGYNSAIGATPDLSRRLVYSVNTIHMGGTDQPAIAQHIIGAAFLGRSPR